MSTTYLRKTLEAAKSKPVLRNASQIYAWHKEGVPFPVYSDGTWTGDSAAFRLTPGLRS